MARVTKGIGKGSPGPGRPRGAPNRTTALLKDAILLAAEDIGEDGKGKGGLQGYLRHIARNDVKAYAVLLGKVLPLHVAHSGSIDGPGQRIEDYSDEELLAMALDPVASGKDRPPEAIYVLARRRITSPYIGGAHMERTFTFRFYDISREKKSIPSMYDMLVPIAGETDKTKRERQLATDYVVRLENFEADGANAVVGELVRCQDTNLPAELTKGTRKALSAERLGHSVVFRLNHKTGELGIQHDRRVVSPGRLLDYIAAFDPKAIYSMMPKLNVEAWAKFMAGDTKKLAIRIANPEHMTDLTGKSAAAGKGFKAMAEAYGAPSILIEISMGHRKGFLSHVGDLAKQLAELGGGARLDKLAAVTFVNDEREELDLIEQRVMVREELEIHARDPETNWKIKREFLKAEMKKLMG